MKFLWPVLLTLSFTSPLAMADEELPDAPKSYDDAPLYDQNDSSTPITPKKSGLFLGINSGLGQSYSTEGSTSPALSYNIGAEVGYVAPMDNWARAEFSGEALTGKVAYRLTSEVGTKAEIPIVLGALAKAGYGYSLGSGMFAVWRLGFGPMLANFKGENRDGTKFENKSLMSGIAGQIALDMVVPMTQTIELIGGIKFTHMNFNLDDVSQNGATVKLSKPINLNVPEAKLGARIRF